MHPNRYKEFILLMYEVQNSLTQTQFRELFGDAATHLWQKFTVEHRYNLLAFFANLDTDKKNILSQYLSTYHYQL